VILYLAQGLQRTDENVQRIATLDTPDVLAKSVVNEVTDQVERMSHYAEVLPHDQKIFAKFDLPQEELARATSAELCEHFVRSPMTTTFGLYSDPNIGIERAIRASTTLAALVERGDAIEGIVGYYNKTNQEIPGLLPNGQPSADAIPVALSLWHADELLLFPEIFARTAGHEKPILDSMRKRFAAVAAANAIYRYPTGEGLFDLSIGTAKRISLLLLERTDPEGAERWKAGVRPEDEAAFLEYISLNVTAP
jgi:hypothetical protein